MSTYLVQRRAGAAVLGSVLAGCAGMGSSTAPRIDLLGMPVIDDSAVLVYVDPSPLYHTDG